MRIARRARRGRPLVVALYLNAGLLLAILVALISRGNGPGAPAYGAPLVQPIAGNGNVYLMPAQFAVNIWGCYLMDIESQNLCAYQYFPGEKQLRFVAARNYREDMRLRDWNTSPSPAEVGRLNTIPRGGIRGAPPAPSGPETPEPPSSAQPPPLVQPPLPDDVLKDKGATRDSK